MQATGTVSPTAAMPPPTLAPEVPRPSELPDEITGALIRELREARGLTLDEVALQTKVRRGVLQAITIDVQECGFTWSWRACGRPR